MKAVYQLFLLLLVIEVYKCENDPSEYKKCENNQKTFYEECVQVCPPNSGETTYNNLHYGHCVCDLQNTIYSQTDKKCITAQCTSPNPFNFFGRCTDACPFNSDQLSHPGYCICHSHNPILYNGHQCVLNPCMGHDNNLNFYGKCLSNCPSGSHQTDTFYEEQTVYCICDANKMRSSDGNSCIDSCTNPTPLNFYGKCLKSCPDLSSQVTNAQDHPGYCVCKKDTMYLPFYKKCKYMYNNCDGGVIFYNLCLNICPEYSTKDPPNSIFCYCTNNYQRSVDGYKCVKINENPKAIIRGGGIEVRSNEAMELSARDSINPNNGDSSTSGLSFLWECYHADGENEVKGCNKSDGTDLEDATGIEYRIPPDTLSPALFYFKLTVFLTDTELSHHTFTTITIINKCKGSVNFYGVCMNDCPADSFPNDLGYCYCRDNYVRDGLHCYGSAPNPPIAIIRGGGIEVRSNEAMELSARDSINPNNGDSSTSGLSFLWECYHADGENEVKGCNKSDGTDLEDATGIEYRIPPDTLSPALFYFKLTVFLTDTELSHHTFTTITIINKCKGSVNFYGVCMNDCPADSFPNDLGYCYCRDNYVRDGLHCYGSAPNPPIAIIRGGGIEVRSNEAMELSARDSINPNNGDSSTSGLSFLWECYHADGENEVKGCNKSDGTDLEDATGIEYRIPPDTLSPALFYFKLTVFLTDTELSHHTFTTITIINKCKGSVNFYGVCMNDCPADSFPNDLGYCYCRDNYVRDGLHCYGSAPNPPIAIIRGGGIEVRSNEAMELSARDSINPNNGDSSTSGLSFLWECYHADGENEVKGCNKSDGTDLEDATGIEYRIPPDTLSPALFYFKLTVFLTDTELSHHTFTTITIINKCKGSVNFYGVCMNDCPADSFPNDLGYCYCRDNYVRDGLHCYGSAPNPPIAIIRGGGIEVRSNEAMELSARDSINPNNGDSSTSGLSFLWECYHADGENEVKGCNKSDGTDLEDATGIEYRIPPDTLSPALFYFKLTVFLTDTELSHHTFTTITIINKCKGSVNFYGVCMNDCPADSFPNDLGYCYCRDNYVRDGLHCYGSAPNPPIAIIRGGGIEVRSNEPMELSARDSINPNNGDSSTSGLSFLWECYHADGENEVKGCNKSDGTDLEDATGIEYRIPPDTLSPALFYFKLTVFLTDTELSHHTFTTITIINKCKGSVNFYGVCMNDCPADSFPNDLGYCYCRDNYVRDGLHCYGSAPNPPIAIIRGGGIEVRSNEAMELSARDSINPNNGDSSTSGLSFLWECYHADGENEVKGCNKSDGTDLEDATGIEYRIPPDTLSPALFYFKLTVFLTDTELSHHTFTTITIINKCKGSVNFYGVCMNDCPADSFPNDLGYCYCRDNYVRDGLHCYGSAPNPNLLYPRARITNGDQTYLSNITFILSGNESLNPNNLKAPHNGLSFLWECYLDKFRQIKGCNTQSNTKFQDSFEANLPVSGNTFKTGIYYFKLTVTLIENPKFSDIAHTSITINNEKEGPLVSITGIFLENKLNPSIDSTLRIIFKDSNELAKETKYEWKIEPDINNSIISGRFFTILKHSMEAETDYILSCNVTTYKGNALVSTLLTTAKPITLGKFISDQSEGIGYQTKFTFTAIDFDPGEGKTLLYKFAMEIIGWDIDIPLTSHFGPNNILKIDLPAGKQENDYKIKVIVTAQNILQMTDSMDLLVKVQPKENTNYDADFVRGKLEESNKEEQIQSIGMVAPLAHKELGSRHKTPKCKRCSLVHGECEEELGECKCIGSYAPPDCVLSNAEARSSLQIVDLIANSIEDLISDRTTDKEQTLALLSSIAISSSVSHLGQPTTNQKLLRIQKHMLQKFITGEIDLLPAAPKLLELISNCFGGVVAEMDMDRNNNLSAELEGRERELMSGLREVGKYILRGIAVGTHMNLYRTSNFELYGKIDLGERLQGLILSGQRGPTVHILEDLGLEREIIALNYISMGINIHNGLEVLSDILTLQLTNHISGEEYKINNIQNPITINFHNLFINDQTPTTTLICAFFDESNRQFSTQGIQTIAHAPTAVTCATSHLSEFALIPLIVKEQPQDVDPQQSQTDQKDFKTLYIILIALGVVIIIVILLFSIIYYIKKRVSVLFIYIYICKYI